MKISILIQLNCDLLFRFVSSDSWQSRSYTMDYLHYKVEEGQVSALKNSTPSHIRYLAEEEFINTAVLIHNLTIMITRSTWTIHFALRRGMS